MVSDVVGGAGWLVANGTPRAATLTFSLPVARADLGG